MSPCSPTLRRRRERIIALLGDLNIAEPEALIGFAGPRVIEDTIRQKLSGWIPAERVPAGARHARCRDASQGVEAFTSRALSTS